MKNPICYQHLKEKNQSEYDIIDFSSGDFEEVIILENKVIPLD